MSETTGSNPTNLPECRSDSASCVTRYEMEQVADRAAEKAVDRAFERIGLDPADLRGNQEDLLYLRRSRITSEAYGSKIRGVVLSLIVAGIVSLLVAGFYATVRKHGGG